LNISNLAVRAPIVTCGTKKPWDEIFQMTDVQSKTRRLRLDERVGYRFSIISKRLNQALAEMHSKKLGISVNNWKIMSVIAFFQPLSATELGVRTSLDSDKVTRAVDALVQRGYVLRRPDDVDRRRVILTLSASGKRVHDRIELVATALESQLLSVLTPEEQGVLNSALDKLQQQSGVLFGRERRIARTEAPGPRQRNGKVASWSRKPALAVVAAE
jgi:DNA-binding MarR family transcriptional regulator